MNINLVAGGLALVLGFVYVVMLPRVSVECLLFVRGIVLVLLEHVISA